MTGASSSNVEIRVSRGQALAIIVVGILGLAMCSGSKDATSEPVPKVAAPLLDVAQRAECTQSLAKARKIGLIRSQPSLTRIDVDDRLWAEMPAELKRKTLAALSCDALGRWEPSSLDEGPIVAYGYRSGKRVAMLTEVGVSFE